MKKTQQEINDQMNMLSDTFAFTLHDLLDEMGLSLSRSQQSRLGWNIAKFAKAKGVGYKKVREKLNKRVIRVNRYPGDSRGLIKKQIKWYLETYAPRKRKRARIVVTKA